MADNLINNDNQDESKMSSDQQAAANLLKSKIDNLYNRQANQVDSGIYNKEHASFSPPQIEQFKKYHSAWQDYYKKYYQTYYSHQSRQNEQNNHQYFKETPKSDTIESQAVSQKEAISELKDKLLSQVSQSADKVKKSKHFVPIISGLIVITMILFVQYNSLIFGKVMAYVSPGKMNSQNIVISPNADVNVSPEPRLIIPKINVETPVNYDIGNDYDSQMTAMANGVAHFAIPGASSRPGQIGNTVLSGHSSSDLFDTGDYKFIFVQLDKLIEGDIIYANYQSKRYTYVVTKKEVVQPNEVNKLIYPTSKPVMTLITCTPVGTARSRLLVTAEQIHPDPSQSIASPNSDQVEVVDMPGKNQTVFERLFSLFNR